MIAPDDEEYQETKLFKLGKRALSPEYQQLSNWVEATYPGVAVLNVRFDHLEPDGLNRLSIIVERQAHEQVFRDGANYRAKDKTRVIAKFREIFASSALGRAQKMFAIFPAFEPVARAEANGNVTKADMRRLKKDIARLDLWEIWQSFEDVTFFFRTDEQLALSETNGAREACRAAYGALTEQYDEFGYLSERPIDVIFASKEGLDRDYEGNLFFWDRR